MLALILFTGENIFTMALSKSLQNDWLYAYPSTNKKDFATKRLTSSHWWRQLVSNKWLTSDQFNTCQSRSQGWWGVLIVMRCCYYIVHACHTSDLKHVLHLLTFPL